MDSLFFFLSLAGLVYGMVNLSGLLILKLHGGDPGTGTLLFPLFALNAVTALEIVRYYLLYSFPGRPFYPVSILFEWARICIACGWIVVTYHHYRLNDLDRLRKGQLTFFGILALILAALVPLGVLGSGLGPVLFPWIHGGVIFMFYFAGVKGFAVLFRGKPLLESSRAGALMAGISIFVYPAVALGDLLGWRFSFLDLRMNLWIQAHPLYFIVVNIPLSVYLVGRFRFAARRRNAGPVPITPENTPTLTDREREVLVLLYQGCRYSEIADRLYLSLATVKTHVYHIYQKLDVSHRGELNVLFRS